MSKSSKKSPAKSYSYLEKWSMPDGSMSERIVVRQSGRFVDNISLTALKSAKPAPNSRKK
jgi:hypothetical protein